MNKKLSEWIEGEAEKYAEAMECQCKSADPYAIGCCFSESSYELCHKKAATATAEKILKDFAPVIEALQKYWDGDFYIEDEHKYIEVIDKAFKELKSKGYLE